MEIKVKPIQNIEAVYTDGKVYAFNLKSNRLIKGKKWSALFLGLSESGVSQAETILPIRVNGAWKFNGKLYSTKAEAEKVESQYFAQDWIKDHDINDFDFWCDMPFVTEYTVKHIV